MILASAALDRLTHHAHTLVIRGESFRQRGRSPFAMIFLSGSKRFLYSLERVLNEKNSTTTQIGELTHN